MRQGNHEIISLSTWVSHYAKQPLVLLVGMALGVQLLYFGYLAYNRYINQIDRIEQMREAISLGIQQSNRSLIESTLTSALMNPDVAGAAVCQAAADTISYPPSDTGYCRQSAHSLWKWSVRRPLIGMRNMDLLVVLSPLATFGPPLFLMSITLFMLASIIWTMSRIRRRLTEELLNPLYSGLNGESSLKVAELEDLRRRNIEHTRLERAQAASEALVQLSAQVAHDIRSPLIALDAALKHTDQLPEKQRVIVRHAVNRIRDIANHLLEKNRLQPGAAATSTVSHVAGKPLEIRLLSSLVDQVITEKRLQYESKPGISINFDLTRESYGLFANIQPVEFGRMISNLVNNAVEALGDKGAVDVRLAHEGKTIILTVADTGKGIQPEILAKLGRKGETHGKAGGSGLGLFHARSTAESWGGSLDITSTQGKGTTITIKLTAAQTPAGFVDVLALSPGRPVVVLDDDPGIHHVWQGRFESARLQEHNIDVLHFSEPASLRAWVKAEPAKAKAAVCLFDYELSGFKETGLSLTEELGLCSQAILVSSRCEEKRIIEDCTRLKVRRIPKSLSDFVPISIAAPATPALRARAVLLDDDALTHMNWQDAAQEHGIELVAFTNPAEFLARLGEFPKDTPLYIDSELGDDVKGEDIAADLKEKGFTNICLATGHEPEHFAHLPWLKVISKESPWRS